MPITYINRQRDIHYFKGVKTKRGKYRYYVTKKITANLLEKLPEGFEIYEHPENAKVVLRKKLFTLSRMKKLILSKRRLTNILPSKIFWLKPTAIF